LDYKVVGLVLFSFLEDILFCDELYLIVYALGLDVKLSCECWHLEVWRAV